VVAGEEIIVNKAIVTGDEIERMVEEGFKVVAIVPVDNGLTVILRLLCRCDPKRPDKKSHTRLCPCLRTE